MIASFASKIFNAGNQNANIFNALNYSGGLETETQDNEGGKASTYIKGIALESMTFTIPLHHRYTDVRAEIESWNSIRDAATPYVFILGERPLGKNKWLLKSTSVTPVVAPGGVLTSATLSLSFEEFVSYGSKAADGASSTRSKKNEEAVHKFSDEALALMADLEQQEKTKTSRTKKAPPKGGELTE